VVSHRIVWSLFFVTGVLVVRRRWTFLAELRHQPRALAALAAAGVAVATNWITYIWAVNNDHLVESSLGYFMNPLVVVLLGVVVLHERMRRLQWVAVGIATLAVLVLTVDYGRLPWIALVLASSFGVYGLLKKQATVAPLESLGVETAALLLPALAYLGYLSADGSAAFGHASAGQHALLIGAGVFTAIPLLLFAAAAQRIPLVTLGILQYLNPTMQFIIGVFVRHEPFPASRFVGFVIVWVALAIFIADGLRRTPATGPDIIDDRTAVTADHEAESEDFGVDLIEPEPV
jgi:chloramphenicol-sensitive protein RarD